MQLPILKFHNIFKSVIWGGTRIAAFKGLPPQGESIGESWELSPMPGSVSVVNGGEFNGKTLNELVERYKDKLLGKTVYEIYGAHFPLLVKFIDTNADLSIQVHPDNDLAASRHNETGKTEMWYMIEPVSGAYFYSGFKTALTKESFREKVKNNTITDSLSRFTSHKGDVVPIPAGRVHSLGPGNLLCEIQQASDITYRIYDYDRRDAQGNPRKLHVEESIDAINFNDTDINIRNIKGLTNKDVVLEICPHFVTTLITIKDRGRFDLLYNKSFSVFVCIKGGARMHEPGGDFTIVSRGDTVLLPATMKDVYIEPLLGEVQFITAAVIK